MTLDYTHPPKLHLGCFRHSLPHLTTLVSLSKYFIRACAHRCEGLRLHAPLIHSSDLIQYHAKHLGWQLIAGSRFKPRPERKWENVSCRKMKNFIYLRIPMDYKQFSIVHGILISNTSIMKLGAQVRTSNRPTKQLVNKKSWAYKEEFYSHIIKDFFLSLYSCLTD